MLSCPSCRRELAEVHAYGVKLEVCNTGCGGVWFDKNELDKFDEVGEPVPPEVLKPIKNSEVVIDRARERTCPCCGGIKLAKTHLDDAGDVEVDRCEKCGGVWLDPGELAFLREDNTANKVMDRTVAETERHSKRPTSDLPRNMAAVLRVLFK